MSSENESDDSEGNIDEEDHPDENADAAQAVPPGQALQPEDPEREQVKRRFFTDETGAFGFADDEEKQKVAGEWFDKTFAWTDPNLHDPARAIHDVIGDYLTELKTASATLDEADKLAAEKRLRKRKDPPSNQTNEGRRGGKKPVRSPRAQRKDQGGSSSDPGPSSDPPPPPPNPASVATATRALALFLRMFADMSAEERRALLEKLERE